MVQRCLANFLEHGSFQCLHLAVHPTLEHIRPGFEIRLGRLLATFESRVASWLKYLPQFQYLPNLVQLIIKRDKSSSNGAA